MTGDELLAGVTSSGGRGGTTGGVDRRWETGGSTTCCCLEMTGGSLAKTDRRIDKKSTIVDRCSNLDVSASSSMLTPWVGGYAHIPCIRPVRQIVVVHPSFPTDVLAGPHQHVPCGRDIDNWWLARVCIRNPQRYRESVDDASESNRQCAGDVEEEGRYPILVCYQRNVS